MDQIQHQNKSLTHFITALFLKRATQLLLSVSVFSYFFHSKFHLSTFSLQYYLGQAMDKNCIFLIFNGLLMLLAKTSGFISLSRPASVFNPPQLFKNTGDIGNGLIEKDVFFEKTGQLEEYPMEGESEDSNLAYEDKEEEEEVPNLTFEVKEEEEEAPNGLLDSTLGVIPVTEGHEESEKELDSIGFFIKQEEEKEEEEEDDEEEEEEEEGLLSADELNKKFDEFIRRMKEEIMIEAKEEIRIEAQQQLVMAH